VHRLQHKLGHGEIEFELDLPGVALYAHRRCIEIWRQMNGHPA
jgi:hypothetical protein